MSKESSFDIVSKVELHEVDNAITQAMKEIAQRYDFKGSKSDITRSDEQLIILSDDEYKLSSVIDILQSKLIKRDVSLKAMNYGKIEAASGGTVRQKVDLVQGIDQENAKKINIIIRDSKLKVKSQVQGEQLRVTAKSKDDLQAIMQLIRQADLTIPVQFTNFR